MKGGEIMAKKRRRKRRTKARHFGDDPSIRHSHGEHTQTNLRQPWERSYRRRKRKQKHGILHLIHLR